MVVSNNAEIGDNFVINSYYGIELSNTKLIFIPDDSISDEYETFDIELIDSNTIWTQDIGGCLGLPNKEIENIEPQDLIEKDNWHPLAICLEIGLQQNTPGFDRFVTICSMVLLVIIFNQKRIKRAVQYRK